jgi:hypothetical protein
MLDRLFSKKKLMEVVEQPAAQLRCATLDGLVALRLGQNKYREGDNPASWACRSFISAWASPPTTSLITFADFSLTRFL